MVSRKVKAELRDIFKREAKTVAITSDAWTSKAEQSYQTYTGHFINREWQLLTFVLRHCAIWREPHRKVHR